MANIQGVQCALRSFRVTFRSLTHFEFICVCVYEEGAQFPYFTHKYPFVLRSLVAKTILSSFNCLGIFVENQLVINVMVYFWTLNAISSTLMPVPHFLDYCCESSNFILFFFKTALAILGHFSFHINVRVSLSISAKRSHFERDPSNLYTNLGRIAILTILSSNSWTWFKFYTSFVQFIPKYLIILLLL